MAEAAISATSAAMPDTPSRHFRSRSGHRSRNLDPSVPSEMPGQPWSEVRGLTMPAALELFRDSLDLALNKLVLPQLAEVMQYHHSCGWYLRYPWPAIFSVTLSTGIPR